jgi:formiminoglutamase
VILPVLVSLPHGGLRVPPEVEDLCILSAEQIARDGDEGASEIYAFPDRVAAHVAADVARAIVDPNRAPDDFGRDGVVKTHTCWDEPVYREQPSPQTRRALLERYWRPYHAELSLRAREGVVLGVDCHTMAATAPPVGPDPGAERPPVCLSDGAGSRNAPFRGGYIVRTHAAELPWVQLELSRAPFASPAEKRDRVLAALQALA